MQQQSESVHRVMDDDIGRLQRVAGQTLGTHYGDTERCLPEHQGIIAPISDSHNPLRAESQHVLAFSLCLSAGWQTDYLGRAPAQMLAGIAVCVSRHDVEVNCSDEGYELCFDAVEQPAVDRQRTVVVEHKMPQVQRVVTGNLD